MKFRAPSSDSCLLTFVLCLFIPALVYPLHELITCSVSDRNGLFVGVEYFVIYGKSPGVLVALGHSLTVSLLVTLCTVPMAFLLAYGLTHTHFPGRRICGTLALIPLFVPSLLPAIGLIYLFGAQGAGRSLLFDQELYGPLGIILGGSIFSLPHALLLLLTTLRGIDGRLYSAAASLGAGPWRRFYTITLPNARYGVMSASFVVFTLTITDFGVPKVLGGNYSVLATEIYAQVIGQQNFSMGAVISLVLLVPSALTLFLDGWARRAQARLRAGDGLGEIKPLPARDISLGLACWGGLILPVASVVVVVWASFMAFWPYDMTFGISNYDFGELGYSCTPLWTSLAMSVCVAVCGLSLFTLGAYLVERGKVSPVLQYMYRLMLLLPLSLPGLVLGLAYIFAFSKGWLSFLYGSFTLLVINTVVHFSTVSHLACSAALGKLNTHYENVGRSMGIPVCKTVVRVILPLCRRSLLDVFFYLFINAMTTVSAVVFLCSSDLTVASISIINMYDSGHLGGAAAMGTLMLCVTGLAASLHVLLKMCLRYTHA